MQEVDVEKEFEETVKFVPKFVVKLPKAVIKPETILVAPSEEAANATSQSSNESKSENDTKNENSTIEEKGEKE